MSEPNRLLVDESISSSAPASPGHLQQHNTKAGDSTKMASSNADMTINLSPPLTGNGKSGGTRKFNRITEFIEDKTQRIRSYFRRRHVPLKRAFDMDLQCGTQTFMLQISDDIEECLYYGNDKLVQKFLTDQGLNLANVNSFITDGMFF